MVTTELLRFAEVRTTPPGRRNAVMLPPPVAGLRTMDTARTEILARCPECGWVCGGNRDCRTCTAIRTPAAPHRARA